MKNILVTGGCGFIGSHTTQVLLENNFNVIILDSLYASSSRVIDNLKKIGLINKKNYSKNLTFFKGDIRDESFLEKIFFKAKNANKPINSVFHFAGLKSINESNSYPSKYWDVNVNGTITLIKVMERFKCRNIVFSSSASVYGNSSKELIEENTFVNPVNVYGRTKSAVEIFLKDIFFENSNSWRIACLRYFNPVGAHKSGLIGENPNNKMNLFPVMSQVAQGLIKELDIFGKNWNTPDGTCIRDYIHILDLASAHLKTLDLLMNEDPQYLILNIGTGKGTSVLLAVETFMKINNCTVPFNFKNKRSGDVAYLVASNKLALSKLKWQPKYSLEDMCSDLWRWHNIYNKKLKNKN